jgi:hypothetical protein
VTVVDPIAPPPGEQAAPPAVERARRPRLLDVTAIVAALAMVTTLAGVAVLALPVHSPLQDCGSSFAFLYHGRTDTFGDPANPPPGKTKAQVRATALRPCRPRVAQRAVLAAELLLGGLLVAIIALMVEVVVRRFHRHR